MYDLPLRPARRSLDVEHSRNVVSSWSPSLGLGILQSECKAIENFEILPPSGRDDERAGRVERGPPAQAAPLRADVDDADRGDAPPGQRRLVRPRARHGRRQGLNSIQLRLTFCTTDLK